jgi:hypothetical protein
LKRFSRGLGILALTAGVGINRAERQENGMNTLDRDGL